MESAEEVEGMDYMEKETATPTLYTGVEDAGGDSRPFTGGM